ncbi:lysozyme inhibitor LprI family protein [Xanthobacter sediminis]
MARKTAESTGTNGGRPVARPARRWAFGLAALALAVSPVAVLMLRQPEPRPGPALAPGPLAETPVAPAADPAPEAEARSGGDGASASALPCPRDLVPAGERSRCLYETIRTSEQALEAELANALRVIDARSDLAPVQRNRWKSLLDEAQSRFLLYRNFDCQSVAPFEGRRGIGNFEERALCLITANTRRAEALAARYGRPTPQDAAPASGGPEPRPGTWTHASPPVLE